MVAMKKTNKELGEEYHEMSVKFAEIVSQVKEIRDRCEWLSQQTQDNGDPYIDLDEVLRKCSSALSSLVIYADEYEKKQEVPEE